MSRSVTEQTGFALLPCSLLLIVVLMSLSAAVRSSRLQQNATQAAADLYLSRVSAESSLAEAEIHLRDSFQKALSPEQGSAPNQPAASACTSAAEQAGRYRLDILRVDEHTALCRITATGTERRVSTSVQAEFVLVDCVARTASVISSEQTPQSTSGQTDEVASSLCKREVRLLSWRVLDAT